MNDLDSAIADLVVANRILAAENVVDAYGHVSIRHPDDPTRYLLSCSRSPELVEPSDIVDFHLDGRSVKNDIRPPYSERFIHGAIYETRPDVMAVVHSHAEDILPFTITTVPLLPVIHVASAMGNKAPVWDIADVFGDTNLLVKDMAQGRDMAQRLGEERIVLMRGHGFSAAAASLIELVKLAVYVPRNARVQMAAMRMGEIRGLSAGEVAAREASGHTKPNAPDMWRAWEYWGRRAGCEAMLKRR